MRALMTCRDCLTGAGVPSGLTSCLVSAEEIGSPRGLTSTGVVLSTLDHHNAFLEVLIVQLK